jgi:hypothetical protein
MGKIGLASLLRAHLREHLRKVRGRGTDTAFDRDAVEQIVPCDPERPLEVRRATRKPADLRLPQPPTHPTDSVGILLQDRGSR